MIKSWKITFVNVTIYVSEEFNLYPISAVLVSDVTHSCLVSTLATEYFYLSRETYPVG